MLNKNRIGLAVGIFFALLHAVWAIIVALGIGQIAIDWILPLHFIDSINTITEFSIGSALILVIMAFIGGYITGWVYSAVYNLIQKK